MCFVFAGIHTGQKMVLEPLELECCDKAFTLTLPIPGGGDQAGENILFNQGFL